MPIAITEDHRALADTVTDFLGKHAALGEARDVEGAEEGMEQARVIGVLHILHVELPVVRQRLDEAPQHLDGPPEHPEQPPAHRVPEIGLERRRGG